MVLDEWTGEIDASFARAIVDRLDALAALGSERRAGSAAGPSGAEGPSWLDAEPIEQQLTDAAESLLKLEGSVARIAEEARRVAAGGGDAKRAWSVALVLGCASGDDAITAAVGTLRSPRMDLRAAAVEALALGRSPAIGPALMRLTEDATPGACAAALEALRFRRQASFAPCVVLLGHPETQVAAAAARCLATVAERKAAALVLRRVLGHDPEDAVAVAAAEGLMALGDGAALSFVRGELEAEIAAPALSDENRVALLRLLALGGDASDVDLFFRSLEPSPRDASAVGWFGHPDLMDWLIGSLETANEARRSGGRGRASSPAPLAPSPFEIAAAQALTRIAGPVDAGAAPGLEASAWRTFWARARPRFAPGQKHRFGKPFTPQATIDELGGPATASIRADAALELTIVSAGNASLETTDWATRQRAALATARDRLTTSGSWTPGTFPGRKLTR
ncbi:Hypothetical protein A7982_02774 [Minicystis rosea]|nr:Hypothetical protein A7982_02774 [Minicystis rosea]